MSLLSDRNARNIPLLMCKLPLTWYRCYSALSIDGKSHSCGTSERCDKQKRSVEKILAHSGIDLIKA